jgi:hypothetical protein
MNSFKHSFTYSAATVIIAVALSMTLFAFSMYESLLNYISYIAYIVLLVIGLKAWRDKEKGGILTYGQAMGYGTLMALVFSVALAIWTFIFMQYIAHDEMQEVQAQKMAETAITLRDKYKMSESEIERSMNMSKSFTTPGVITAFALFGNMFILTIVNLIVAAIMKKDPQQNELSPNTSAY